MSEQEAIDRLREAIDFANEMDRLREQQRTALWAFRQSEALLDEIEAVIDGPADLVESIGTISEILAKRVKQ